MHRTLPPWAPGHGVGHRLTGSRLPRSVVLMTESCSPLTNSRPTRNISRDGPSSASIRVGGRDHWLAGCVNTSDAWALEAAESLVPRERCH